MFTVIIAVYNSQETIERAIRSVFNHNVAMKAIIIDDCSADSSVGIVEHLQLEFKDLELIKLSENMGPGYARNMAIERVNTKHFTVLDADDEFIQGSFDEIQKLISKNDADVYKFNHIYINQKKYAITPSKNRRNLNGMYKGIVSEFLLLNNFYTWGKIYNTEFIRTREIKYSEGVLYEDFIFISRVFTEARKVYCDNSYILKAHVLESSATRKIVDDTHIRSFYLVLDQMRTVKFRNVKAMYDVVLELESRVEQYALKDVPERHEKNRILLEKKLSELKETWGYYEEFSLFDFEGKKEISIPEMINFDLLTNSLQEKYKNNTKYVLLNLLGEFGLKQEFILFMGFDFGFRGNSKYLFLKMKQDGAKNIFFVTKDPAVPEKYRIEPYSAEYFFYIALAKVIYCESYIDMKFMITGKTKLVQLWHGIQLKKLKCDSPETYIVGRNPSTKDNLGQFLKFDEVLYLNEYQKKKMKSGFLISDHQLVHGTYPRVDWSKKMEQTNYKTYLRNKYKIRKSDKVILYAPTWRDKWIEERDLSPLLDLSGVEIKEGYKLVVLPHPYLGVDFLEPTENILKIDIETQELILISDYCISDYSSIIFDFFEIDKPVYLMWKDLEEYSKYRGVYDEAINDLSCIVYEDEAKVFDDIYNERNKLDETIKAKYISNYTGEGW